MAVGLQAPSRLLPVKGVRLSSYAAGIRYEGREDLVLVELAAGTESAAVFTCNSFCAAPVMIARNHLEQTSPRYLLINSGNANAGTGKLGERDTMSCCRKLADLGHCRDKEVLPLSTGVIGERLPVENILKALPNLKAGLKDSEWLAAAKAMMTTDTVPKGISRRLQFEDKTVTVTGIAKGSGMICPNMATMLSFVATDAMLSRALLNRVLRQAVDASFNSITVDGDTSTNDACVLSATGKSGVDIAADGAHFHHFFETLLEVMCHLAQAIIRDGEGATKFITLSIKGASSHQEARRVAYTLAHSPLVKTAFYAGDANWGRLLAALGRADVEHLDISHVDLYLDEVLVFSNGRVDPSYMESAGQDVMRRPDITVCVDLHRGVGEAKVYTTDLSHDYVRINAEYRT